MGGSGYRYTVYSIYSIVQTPHRHRCSIDVVQLREQAVEEKQIQTQKSVRKSKSKSSSQQRESKSTSRILENLYIQRASVLRARSCSGFRPSNNVQLTLPLQETFQAATARY